MRSGSARSVKITISATVVGEANFLCGTVSDVSDSGSATVEIEGVALSGIDGGGLAPGAPATHPTPWL